MPDECRMPDAGAATSAVHVLSARPGDGVTDARLPGLAQFLELVPDHRRAQGRRHSLVPVLALACAAKSQAAIAAWAAAAPALVLDGLGVRRDPCGGALVPPGAGRR